MCVCVCVIYIKSLGKHSPIQREIRARDLLRTIEKPLSVIFYLYTIFFSLFSLLSFSLSLFLSIYLSLSLRSKNWNRPKYNKKKKLSLYWTQKNWRRRRRRKRRRGSTLDGGMKIRTSQTGKIRAVIHQKKKKNWTRRKRPLAFMLMKNGRSASTISLEFILSLFFFMLFFFRSLSLSLLDLHTYTYSMIAPLSGWLLFDCSYELSTGKSAQNTCGVHLFIRAFSFIIVIFFCHHHIRL